MPAEEGRAAPPRPADRLTRRIVLMAVGWLQLPLLGLLTLHAGTGPRRALAPVLAIAVATTVAGATVLVRLTSRLLRPLDRAGEQLTAYRSGHQIVDPHEAPNELGRLSGELASVLAEVDAERRGLDRASKEDVLTGLLNRRGAVLQLQVSVALAIRKQLPLSVAIVDVDEFKRVNDTYGHPTGDAVLVQVADAVRASLRRSDWAARWGGEELLVVMFETADGARAALERIRRDATTVPRVTLSAGVAPVEDDVEAAIAAADQALLEAKRTGRDRVALARPGHQASA